MGQGENELDSYGKKTLTLGGIGGGSSAAVGLGLGGLLGISALVPAVLAGAVAAGGYLQYKKRKDKRYKEQHGGLTPEQYETDKWQGDFEHETTRAKLDKLENDADFTLDWTLSAVINKELNGKMPEQSVEEGQGQECEVLLQTLGKKHQELNTVLERIKNRPAFVECTKLIQSLRSGGEIQEGQNKNRFGRVGRWLSESKLGRRIKKASPREKTMLRMLAVVVGGATFGWSLQAAGLAASFARVLTGGSAGGIAGYEIGKGLDWKKKFEAMDVEMRNMYAKLETTVAGQNPDALNELDMGKFRGLLEVAKIIRDSEKTGDDDFILRSEQLLREAELFKLEELKNKENAETKISKFWAEYQRGASSAMENQVSSFEQLNKKGWRKIVGGVSGFVVGGVVGEALSRILSSPSGSSGDLSHASADVSAGHGSVQQPAEIPHPQQPTTEVLPQPQSRGANLSNSIGHRAQNILQQNRGAGAHQPQGIVSSVHRAAGGHAIETLHFKPGEGLSDVIERLPPGTRHAIAEDMRLLRHDLADRSDDYLVDRVFMKQEAERSLDTKFFRGGEKAGLVADPNAQVRVVRGADGHYKTEVGPNNVHRSNPPVVRNYDQIRRARSGGTN